MDYDSHGIVGFTDLVSNTVVLEDISPLSRTPEILAGSLSLSFLPGIAHEAAHHACLDSPVGLALCSLWQSSFTLWWDQIDTEIPQQSARDLAVASVANLLLQPLLEGLALFCEHDLVTGASPVISRVTQRVAALFSKGRMSSLLSLDPATLRLLLTENRDALFSVGHSTVLRLARSSDEWTERKRLLLTQPLNGSNRYLLGYLAVKGMHATLVPTCHDFLDPELFFVAVVRHFMHDKTLAEILGRFRNKVDDPRAGYVAVGMDLQDLLVRFQDLCDELYKSPDRVARTATASVIAPLNNDSNRDRAVDFGEILMGLRTVGTMNIAWPRLMKHRQEFRFSFQSVLIRLARNGEATILDINGSREICRVVTTDGCRPTSWKDDIPHLEFEGSVEAIQLRDLTTFVVGILSHDGLVAVLDCKTGQWNPKELVDLLDDMPSAIAVEGAMHAFAEWQSITKDRDGVRDLIEHYENQTRAAVDHLYPQLIVRGWESSRRDRFVQAFYERGVFSIYRAEDETLLSKLSLTAGLGNSLEDVARAMEFEPHELRQLVSRLNETSKRACGFEPFALTEKVIRSRI